MRAASKKAIVFDGVYYRAGHGSARAPAGEYAMRLAGDAHVRFLCSNRRAAFSLSLDTVLQHVREGRLLIV